MPISRSTNVVFGPLAIGTLHTLIAYRRTWLKLLAPAAAEGLVLKTLPKESLFYEEATRVTVAGQLALVILGYCKSALENMRTSSEFSEFPVKKTLDVVESLHGSKIELIVTRQDQPAAFVAATYGRLTGKRVLTTSFSDKIGNFMPDPKYPGTQFLYERCGETKERLVAAALLCIGHVTTTALLLLFASAKVHRKGNPVVSDLEERRFLQSARDRAGYWPHPPENLR